MLVTQRGMQLNTKILQRKEKLSFSRVAASTETINDVDPADRVALGNDAFPALTGLSWGFTSKDTEIEINAALSNESFTQPIIIREIGVFANDPDDGEILYAIDILPYDEDDSKSGLLIPARLTVPYIHTFALRIEIKRGININVDFILTNYLSLEQAKGKFWVIGEKYPATEITETVGRTVEEHQRWQDEQLTVLTEMAASGTTSATPVDLKQWKIINYNGFYDQSRAAYRAGRYIPPVEGEQEPEPENVPDDEIVTPPTKPPGNIIIKF